MIVTVSPGEVAGLIEAPVSKSAMQRACAIALLANGVSIIKNPGNSNDDKAALDVITRLGAIVEHMADGSIKIIGNGVNPPAYEINCGESGLGIRMFTPLAALSSKKLNITGKGSLISRPMDFFDDVFPLLNVQVKSNNGKLPLEIKGPLEPDNITIDGSLSSQFLTGLLLAYAASDPDRPATITVTDLRSKPYIDLTLQLLKFAGIEIDNNNYLSFTFPAGRGKINPLNYTVEGDWSGGAFLLVAGAVNGPVRVGGLDMNSTQADIAILDALKDAGAIISEKDGVISAGPGSLTAFQFDATDCPDLFPPLVALAAYCKGNTSIRGVGRLAHKESNRGLTLQEEFGKMNVEIELQDDIMLVKGGAQLNGATVSSHHDHRIAMACAVAGIGATGQTIIENAEAINKSYPDFYEHMKSLGLGITIDY